MAIIAPRRMEQAIFEDIVRMSYEMLLADVVNKYARVKEAYQGKQDTLCIVLNHRYMSVSLYWITGRFGANTVSFHRWYEPCGVTHAISHMPEGKDVPDMECWNECAFKEMKKAGVLKKQVAPEGTRKNLWVNALK